MDVNLLIICILTFIIHLIGTLAYSVRIAGVRTKKIALSFTIFNILILLSRTSNTFQGPFLAKRIENSIQHPMLHDIGRDFGYIILSATVATIFGGLLIPTFQRLFSIAVEEFQTHRSFPRLLTDAFLSGGMFRLGEFVSIPESRNVSKLRKVSCLSYTTIGLNVVAVALWTIGVFSALYAGYLNPSLRVTSSSLSSIINGVATVLMFVVIDPQLSVMTDDVVAGNISEGDFRRSIVWLVASRLAGTVLAQILLLPAAKVIVLAANVF